jgi:SAM-dependent methyltransferase
MTLLFMGAHYRSEFLYNAITLLKLGWKYDLRYQIAARYIKSGESVVDVCSGSGRLKDFIPKDCSYTAIEASPEFLSILKKKGINSGQWDLHAGWLPSASVFDVIVMVISFYHFRETSASRLLESFKKAAKRVVIVEDVLRCPRGKGSMIQRAMNYLCRTDYYVPVASWYTRPEFEQLMRGHGYQCEAVASRYMVGSYGFPKKPDHEGA